MLVLARKQNQSIDIGGGIIVTVVEIRGDKVRLGITAPPDVTIHRREISELLADKAFMERTAQETP